MTFLLHYIGMRNLNVDLCLLVCEEGPGKEATACDWQMRSELEWRDGANDGMLKRRPGPGVTHKNKTFKENKNE